MISSLENNRTATDRRSASFDMLFESARMQKDLEERRTQLETSIARMQAETDLAKVNQLSADEIVFEASDLQARWPKMDAAQKRQIVETITQKITVTKDEVLIELFYIPSGKEVANGWRKGRDLNPR